MNKTKLNKLISLIAVIMLIVTLLLQPVLTVCAEEPDESQLDAVPVSALVSAQDESADSADETVAAASANEAVDAAQNEAVSVNEVAEVTTDSEAANAVSENEAVEVPADEPAANEDISGRDFGLTAKGAVLMEASSKTVIYESNADTQMSPASITKIMTLILIFDAINAGKISLKDEVVTSARAKSMGGSQVFLEEGEKQTVETLIKCIVIASGNDASVAMAEYIGGTEEEFVNMMNERAKELGMNNTHFVDCCGLTEDPAHLTTARDVALMARELIVKYPQIKDYSTIWMDTITHVTNKGSSEFGLSNTNKLLKMATNFTVTGLKTGSTSKAKYCVAATAYKDGIEMIAVILGAADYKVRFSEAEKLLNFGYSKCRLYKDSDEQREPLEKIKVDNGKQDYASLEYNGDFSFVDINGADLSKIEKRIELEDKVKAPIEAGQVLGYLIYELDGKVIGKVEIVAADSVEEADFIDCLRKISDLWKL